MNRHCGTHARAGVGCSHRFLMPEAGGPRGLRSSSLLGRLVLCLHTPDDTCWVSQTRASRAARESLNRRPERR